MQQSYRRSTIGGEMDIASLQNRFGVHGILSFDSDQGLTRLNLARSEVQATMYLYWLI
jgi:hypothetical protein